MKKLTVGIATAAVIAATALSFTACGKTQLRVIDINLTAESYGYCVAEGNSSVMAQVNSLIDSLCGSKAFQPDGTASQASGMSYDFDGDGENETVTFKTIYDAVKDGTARDIGAVATEIPSDKTRSQCLVVATNAEFEPFEYKSGANFAGIDMWVAKLLAERMGRTLVVKDMRFESVVTSVGSGETDIGMAGLTINASRKQNINFSKPYYVSAQRVAVSADEKAFDNCQTEEDVCNVIKGMKNVKAGGATGQTGYMFLAGNAEFEFEGFSNIETLSYDNIGAAVMDCANGKIKFVVGDMDTLISAVSSINNR